MKRTGTRAGRRATPKRPPATRSSPKTQSPKAVAIVRLVEALSAGLGAHDGVVLGGGLATLLRDRYNERGRAVPRWVQELLAHYAREKPAP